MPIRDFEANQYMSLSQTKSATVDIDIMAVSRKRGKNRLAINRLITDNHLILGSWMILPETSPWGQLRPRPHHWQAVW